MDKVLDKLEASEYLNMTLRNLNLCMEKRLVPFIKVFISGSYGQVFFSKNKLAEWERRLEREDLATMTEGQKEGWRLEKKMNIVVEQKKERASEVIALKMIYYSRKLKGMLDVKNSGLTEDEQTRQVSSSELFGDYMDLIPRLHKLEKERLLDFFQDEDCLFQRFPDFFQPEVEAKKKVEEAGKVKREDYPTLPGTKKPTEENIQVVQETSELWKKTDGYLKK